jgi:hypothetical protein
MPHILHVHNEHCSLVGPDDFYAGPYDWDQAKAALVAFVASVNAKQQNPALVGLFKVSENGLEAGFDPEELDAADEQEDIAYELYCEIVELHPTLLAEEA